jgi:GMP synthase-like glutamine amidotransferase
MIGAALGGVVEKAPTGWCIGVHEFEITYRETWMNPSLNDVRLLMMCQDQVVQLPAKSRVLATSPSCPNAMILVGTNMLGIQGHPEFSVDFEDKLIRANARYFESVLLEQGLASLGLTNHSAEVGLWMARFLQLAT